MMNCDVAIRAEGLGKKYLIGHQAQTERYTSLRDVLARTAGGLLRSAADMAHGRQIVAGDEIEEFWALRDVNFEIRRGEVVGVIGRNGAGKSTLLKVLSRITEPTEGRVTINGRVASLLEVGTGFHPELSGRENIYLNGAILGMSRAEIRRKFDEIVDFAGVEKFLDTPVKRYSSGMYVRLAFSVAAHLEPEILIVDEVLAVGDAEFQKKCLGKMGEVASSGRSVLFVSHNISAVRALCSKGVVLDFGRLIFSGEVTQAIKKYEHSLPTGSTQSKAFLTGPLSALLSIKEATITQFEFKTKNVDPCFDFEISVTTEVLADFRNLIMDAHVVRDSLKVIVMTDRPKPEMVQPGVFKSKFKVPGNTLLPGRFTVNFGAVGGIGEWAMSQEILSFEVNDWSSSSTYSKSDGVVQVAYTSSRVREA